MRMSKFLILILAAMMTASCAKVYYSPDARTKAQSHKLIAIVPPKVGISNAKKIDAQVLQEQQQRESETFQQEMYSWMLKRKMQGKFKVDILDVETTNSKLINAGYGGEKRFSPAEMCEILGVDGIITSTYSLSRPLSTGGAVAIGVITGFWGSTNETSIALEIHDAGSKKMIWNYNHKASGGVGSTPTKLVDNLMRNASKKMPYTK